MKEEILSEIRSYVFMKTLAKVSGMLDQYRTQIEGSVSKLRNETEDLELLRDQIEHLLKALTMISEVPETAEGATMARGIAAEAMSTTR